MSIIGLHVRLVVSEPWNSEEVYKGSISRVFGQEAEDSQHMLVETQQGDHLVIVARFRGHMIQGVLSGKTVPVNVARFKDPELLKGTTINFSEGEFIAIATLELDQPPNR